MTAIYKFGWGSDHAQRFEYPDIFAVEKTTGPERLIIAPGSRQVSLMLGLLDAMTEPFGILYILTVPRGGGKAGRYQSAELLARSEVGRFFRRFERFFENDGRHHIWATSIGTDDNLVYDNHNVIYAYGRLPEFERIVMNRGLSKVDRIEIPSPHIHQYNSDFDREERAVLSYWKWKHFPLQESDEG